MLALGAGLAGCGASSPLNALNPLTPAVDLYHGLQGGEIAQQRPPPPGADAPYPNLGSIPPRPAAPDIAAQEKLADQLAAQRDAALAAVASNPATPLAPAKPAPPAKTPPAAAPAEPANKVVVAAADAPPAKPAPATPAAPAAALPALTAVPAVPAAVTPGPAPSLAAAPPAPPADVGLAIPPPPAQAAQAAQAAPAPPAPPANPNTVQIAFTPNSFELPPSATLTLRKFALAHKGVPVTITGHGGVVLPAPDSQSRALDLALKRAQAIAASLNAAGIPAANLHVHAEAAGQGGSASL